MATLEKVQTQIAKLQARADELITKQSSTVVEKIRNIMEKHGLTTADIDAYVGGKKRGRPAGAKLATTAPNVSSAKYRDPKTGATWTGHGRAPAWITEAKDRSRFLADGRAEAPARTTTVAEKAGNYPRGPQPAKYRDPKTGATWSGRGPAPAWLASVKDRSRYLIAAADEVAETTTEAPAKEVGAKKKVVVKKAASAKKAAVKKAVTKKAPATKTVAKKRTASAAKTAPKKPAGEKVAASRTAGSGKAAARKRVAMKNGPKATESFVEVAVAATDDAALATV
jgi:DNA-binding protein H-NS